MSHGYKPKFGSKLNDFRPILYNLKDFETELKEDQIIGENDLGYGVVGGMAVQIYLKKYMKETPTFRKKLKSLTRSSNDIDILINPKFKEYLPEKLKEHGISIGKLELIKHPYKLLINEEGGKKLNVQLLDDNKRLNEEGSFEKFKIYKNLEVNVLSLEHLTAFKISRYNSEGRMFDYCDVLSLAPIIASRIEKNSFSFDTTDSLLKKEYQTNSEESRQLYERLKTMVKIFIDQKENHSNIDKMYTNIHDCIEKRISNSI